MKKLSLIMTTSILLIACGSNAENNVTEVAENIQQEKSIVKEVVTVEEVVKINNNVGEELIEELETVVPVAENNVIAETNLKKEKVKKEIVKETEQVVEVELEQLSAKVIIKADHDVWNSLTMQNVTAAGKVNYKGMKANLGQITLYLSHLENTPPKADWTKNEKLAYWINLYNASTVYLIATNYPTTSITKLNGGKPWDKKFVKSGGKTYSLNQIENEIVRPRFKDPRIHAALNCAAVSCPKMLNSAFLPASLSKQLDKQCYAWINDKNRNEVGPNSLKLSQIFDWYGEDFKAGGGVIKFVGKYNRTKIMINPNAKISYLEYDWALND